MTKLKLEMGKYYRTRDGLKVGLHINHHGGSDKWPFYHDCGDDSYHAVDQFGLSCIGCRGYDIIAEWTDTPSLKVGDKVKVVAGYGGTLNGRIGEVTQFDGRNVFVASHQGLPQHACDVGEGTFHLYFFGSEVEPIPTIGTLAEIGAQVGDVVKAEGYGRALTVEAIDRQRDRPYFLRNVDGDRDWYAGTLDKWRIISRASDAKSPVKLSVDLDEAIKQVVAESRSGPVQLRKVIVPGMYGKVRVETDGPHIKTYIEISDYMSRDDLTAAIETLTAIRDSL